MKTNPVYETLGYYIENLSRGIHLATAKGELYLVKDDVHLTPPGRSSTISVFLREETLEVVSFWGRRRDGFRVRGVPVEVEYRRIQGIVEVVLDTENGILMMRLMGDEGLARVFRLMVREKKLGKEGGQSLGLVTLQNSANSSFP